MQIASKQCLSVGAVQVEIIKSGSPDWSDSKSISLISVGK